MRVDNGRIHMKRFLGLIAAALLLSACVSDNNTDNRSIANNKYVNPAVGLSLQFPANWQLKLDYVYGSLTFDLVALAPPIQNFSPNVSVQIGPHSGTTDMAVVLDTLGKQLKSQVPDLGQYQAVVKELNGKKYGEITYTTTSVGNLLKFKQDFILNMGKDITITYTDFASRFDQNSDFASIDQSLSF
jgi:hypothetical protein